MAQAVETQVYVVVYQHPDGRVDVTVHSTEIEGARYAMDFETRRDSWTILFQGWRTF
jgi:hypothetical protein